MLSPVIIILPISCPVHSAVTRHDPIANLLPCTQCCHLSWSHYYSQYLALYTALLPVMIPLPLPISCLVHSAVTCHYTTANLSPSTQRCHLSWSHYHFQSLALYTVLSPVMIPLLLPISCPAHSAVTCHDPITTGNISPSTQRCHLSWSHTCANLFPCTQRCHVSWYYWQSLALYTALSPQCK